MKVLMRVTKWVHVYYDHISHLIIAWVLITIQLDYNYSDKQKMCTTLTKEGTLLFFSSKKLSGQDNKWDKAMVTSACNHNT